MIGELFLGISASMATGMLIAQGNTLAFVTAIYTIAFFIQMYLEYKRG